MTALRRLWRWLVRQIVTDGPDYTSRLDHMDRPSR